MEIHNPAGDTAVSSKRRKRRRGKKKATSQILDQMGVNLEASQINDCEIAKNSLAEGSVSAKRKRKRKKFKSKAGNNCEVKSRDQLNSVSSVQLSDKSLRLEIGDKLTNEGAQHTNQDLMCVETINLTEGNMNQRMGQSYFISKLQPSDTNLRQEICDKLAENVYVQHIDQNKVDTESAVNLAEGSVSIKRKRKRKRIKGKTEIEHELQSLDQSNSASNLHTDNDLRQEIDNKLSENEDVRSTDQKKTMDIESAYKAGNNDEVKSRDQLNSVLCEQLSDKSLRLEIDYKLMDEAVQHTNQDLMDIETVNLTEGNMNQRMGQSDFMSKLNPSDANLRQEICDKLAENVDVQHIGQNKVDMESTVNLAEGNVSIKRKRKKKRIKRKTGNKDELQSVDQSNSVSNLHSDNNLGQEIDNKLTENEDVRSTDQKTRNIESTCNLAEGNMKSEHKNKDKVQSLNPANDISNLQFAENSIGQTLDSKLIRNGCTAQEFNFPGRNEYKLCHSDHLVDMVEVSNLSASSEVLKGRRPMGLEGKVFPCESQQKPAHNQILMEDVKFQSALNKVNNGLFVVEGTTTFGPSGVKEAESISKDLGEYPSRPPPTTDRRKLLVLDVNGLLACIVMPPPKDRKADINILRRAVFKRPFCDDFLKFCFQHFDVGIWSSRAENVIDKIVDYLLGNLKSKLLFCWNMSHSTQSGFKTLENIHKPLVCKELRKIWGNDGAKLSWKKGQYNESNTLLIDDSPYKALLNPLHTAIFPHPYHYEDKYDNSLGPGGDLRVYLEGLLKSESVQEYVEHHPFGQSAINETNVSWEFYSGVLQKFSNKIGDINDPTTPVVTSSQNVPSPSQDKVLDLEPNGTAHSTATLMNEIDPEVHPIHSSLVVSASQ